MTWRVGLCALQGVVGGVVVNDVASLDVGGIDELPPAWPQGGAFTGGLDGGGSSRA